MPKIKTGTRAGKGVVVIKGQGGLRKLRCPKCHGMTTEVVRQDGQSAMRCTSCGTEFSSRAL